MTNHVQTASHPGVLLIEHNKARLQALSEHLQHLPYPVFGATDSNEARILFSTHPIAIIICQADKPEWLSFLNGIRKDHTDVSLLMLTADKTDAPDVQREAQPFKLMTTSPNGEELLDNIRLAVEEYKHKQEREHLAKEYKGILSNAERSHAFRVLDALMHSIHNDMTAEAIHHLPVGAVLLRNETVSAINAPAHRFLGELKQDLQLSCEDEGTLPSILQDALAAPRRQRMQRRLSAKHRLDYFVLELSAGTLIAFAPEPHLGRPPEY
ncbi:hypothetical protein [Undibacterium sp. TJN19]|uniref:hypothetical protein n=1 Tax=Undibacterium sp. TJN19 TaxID=3413055 RepID=UPI003BF05E2D